MMKMKNHPYFLEPIKHRLGESQKISAPVVLILAAIVFLGNEFFFRPGLESFNNTGSQFSSLFVLMLNAQVPLDQGHKFIFLFISFACIFLVTFSLLPKWGKTPRSLAMKKGVPDYDDYDGAYFYIENSVHKFAFTFWYHYLMRISILFQIFFPCMLINLLRTMS
jgi:hypothetical protein